MKKFVHNSYVMYKLVNLKYFYCRDFESLNPRDIKQNNKTAFDAAASLGITRIIEPADMVCFTLPFVSIFTAKFWLHYETDTQIPGFPKTISKYFSYLQLYSGNMPGHYC